jgi:hypothetical protein
MNIITATKDKNLFLPYLQGHSPDLKSWRNWLICLRVIYGLSVKKPENLELIKACTGRDPNKLPKDGFNTVLLLVGRRGGKSRIAGLIGGYESLFSGKEKRLSPGEIPMVTITSPTREQSTIIKSYTRAALKSPMLEAEVDDDNRQGFQLSNGVTVRIMTGDFRSVRGFTQLMVVVDELCFFGFTEESKVNSDTELIRSIRPALLTTQGKLVCVSTKYAPRGWAYSQWKRHWGNDNSRVLVWDAASRIMNPTLSQADIDEAMADDPEAARAEYLNEWREDVQNYLPREVVESCVVKGRMELLPRENIRYSAFCDTSGGRADSAGLAIGHKTERKIIIDFLKEYLPPFSPYEIAGRMAVELKRYGLKTVIGDRFGSEYTVQAFNNHGIRYQQAEKNKSELYLELIGPICSKEIELLDNEKLITQLSNLERRTRSGGKDTIDHSAGQHDDLSNCIAGVSVCLGKPKIFAGGGFIIGNKNILVGI